MFSSLWKKASKKAVFMAVPLVLAGLIFASCDNSTSPSSNPGGPIDAQMPKITSHPRTGVTFDVAVDNLFELKVVANTTDGGEITYQWFSTVSKTLNQGGTVIEGATSDTFTLNRVNYKTDDKNGHYYFYVEVTNTITTALGDGGIKSKTAFSNVADIIVDGAGGVHRVYANPPLVTLSQRETWYTDELDTFELTVEVESQNNTEEKTSIGLSYQWYSTKSTTNTTTGDIIEEATTDTLTLNKADYSENGPIYFYVIVTDTIFDNDDGGDKTADTTSTVATVIVDGIGGIRLVNADPPVLTGPDATTNWSVYYDVTKTLTVNATKNDSGVLTYQWYKTDSVTNSTGGTLMEGETGEDLILDRDDYTANGDYFFYVIVTNTIPPNGDKGVKSQSITSHPVSTVSVTGNVTFVRVTASYPPDIELTLTFNVAIPGLSAADITLTSDFDDVEVGALGGDGPSYTLPIGGFDGNGTFEVTLAKEGYHFIPSSRLVNVSNEPPLEDGVWREGEFTETLTSVEYLFDVQEGKTYYVFGHHVDSGPIPNDKTADIAYSARYIDSDPNDGTYGTGSYFFGNPTSGYTARYPNANYLTATKDGIIVLKVYCSYLWDWQTQTSSYITGTYAVVYSSVSIRPGAAVSKTINIDEWVDETINGADVDVYAIDVEFGKTYNVWWNDSGYDFGTPTGNGMKTADIEVQARYADDTLIFNINNESYGGQWKDGAWATPQSFMAIRTGTVHLRVRAYSSSGMGKVYSSGSYGIAYSQGNTKPITDTATLTVGANGSVGTPTTELTLTFDKPISGLTANSITLSMGAVAVTKGALTGSGSNYTLKIGADFDGTLNVRVAIDLLGITGSPALVPIYGTSSNPTPLVADKWEDRTLSAASDIEWFSFDVIAGETYRIWWNDDGSYSPKDKTAEVLVSAWYFSSKAIIMNNVRSGYYDGWRDSEPFTPTVNGTVYIKVVPASNYYGTIYYTGTYGIVYSKNSTRPPKDSATLLSINANGTSGTPTTTLTLTFDKEVYALSPIDIILTPTTNSIFGVKKGALTNVGAIYTLEVNAAEDLTVSVTPSEVYSITPDSTLAVPILVSIWGDGGASIPVLPINKWEDGAVSAASKEHWYRLNLSAGTQYSLWWNDDNYSGPGNKTGQVEVSAWYFNSKTVILKDAYSNSSRGWAGPSSFTPAANDTVVLVKVVLYSDYYGTYGIAYNSGTTRPFKDSATLTSISANGTPTNSLTLVFNKELDGLTAADIILTPSGSSIFGVVKGALTHVGATYTLAVSAVLDVTVSVTPSALYGITPGPLVSVPIQVTISGDGGASIPNLTEGTWIGGDLATGDVGWHKIPVSSGTAYRIWCDGSWGGSGDSSITLDLKGAGWFVTSSATTSIFTLSSSAWNSPAPSVSGYTPTADGTIFVKIEPYYSSGSGTYRITYTANNETRPVLP